MPSSAREPSARPSAARTPARRAQRPAGAPADRTARTAPADRSVRTAPADRPVRTAPVDRPVRTAPADPTPDAASRPASAISFASLGVPAVLTRVLAAQGVTEPFPIQAATLPDALTGRDVLGRGRTGSGKTLAFAIPLVARLASGPASRPKRPRGLVLAPTRELATQIAAVVEPLAATSGLRVTTIFGGVAPSRQTAALSRGVDIVVACPGRLEDLVRQRAVVLDAVEITVLDEADHMADLGFLPGVRRILDATPKGGQRLLFSATLDNGVDVLVQRYLSRPRTHAVPETTAAPQLDHYLLEVTDQADKRDVVHRLASGSSRRVLFTRTKHRARALARQLNAAGIPAVDLHGNLSQPARERNLAAFASGRVNVLVATDIAARGIHVDDVDLVLHVDPPTEQKAYVHRSGRTARAGSHGTVVVLALPEERNDVRRLTRAAGIGTTVRAGAHDRTVLGALLQGSSAAGLRSVG